MFILNFQEKVKSGIAQGIMIDGRRYGSRVNIIDYIPEKDKVKVKFKDNKTVWAKSTTVQVF